MALDDGRRAQGAQGCRDCLIRSRLTRSWTFQPFLAQAEQEKLEYEAARKLYEEGTTGYGNSINFSILPGGPINLMPIPRASQRPIKQELSSESESDGFNTDDGADNTLTSPRRR